MTKIGVIGAGVMGRGIVQLFVQAGFIVRFFDSRETAVDEATAFVVRMLQKVSPDLTQVNARLQPCKALEDLAACDLIIEAIAEVLPAKKTLFAQLETMAKRDAILVSNTSSLLISEIAAGCERPERIAGLHFFNPVPLMKVVEVIPGVRTAPETIQRLVHLVNSTGHRAVVAADQPGFLVNHAGRGLYTEGLRILEEGVAEPADIDRVLREACGFRMGPFELMDLTGLDVSGPVMESIYAQFHHEPRFRPSSLVRSRIAAGLFGRKSGAGWYQYADQKRIDPPEAPAPARTTARVWIDPNDDSDGRLTACLLAAGATLADSPDQPATTIVIQPWGTDASDACAVRGLDASRCVAVDPLPPFDRRRTIMLTAVTSPEARDCMHALLAADGVPVTIINDSPGFIAQRVLATIVNIACNIVQRRIATVDDIEVAVPLALGYPSGPLHWGDRIGPKRVLHILERMLELTGDPRYRASPWLRRRAQLGLSLCAGEPARMAGQEIRTSE